MPSPDEVIAAARMLLSEQHLLQNQTAGTTGMNTVDDENGIPLSWKRPNPGVIKINTDAAWYNVTNKGGLGAIARNHRGQIVGDFQGAEVADNVEHLEARAVYEGIRIDMDMLWENVIIESDAISIINHLRGIYKSSRIEIVIPNGFLSTISPINIVWSWTPRLSMCGLVS